MPKTTHDLGLKTSIQTFDAFVRCTLMGNQPWSQFQNGIREKSIEIGKFLCREPLKIPNSVIRLIEGELYNSDNILYYYSQVDSLTIPIPEQLLKKK